MARPFGVGARDDEVASSDEHLAQVLPLARPDHCGPSPGPAHRLPARWSSFVGRTREIDEVAALLRSAHLVTITGPGGWARPGWLWR
jgi:hypothetical protein